MTPELAELRAHLKEARGIAARLPECQPLLVNLDDMLEDVEFLQAAETATR